MTRRPLRTRATLQVLGVLVAVGVLAGLVGQLRRSAPYEQAEFLVEASDEREDVLTCERTLPDEPTTPEGAEQPEPVGRITSTQVIECPDIFDGHTVVYVGEVVGDVLRRDGGAWTLMNDDAYALEVGPLRTHGEHRGYNSGLAVWLEGDLRDLADEPGGPGQRGDVLRVQAVVRRADPQDGGGLTLRAVDAEVIAEAQPLEPPLHVGQAVAAVVLSLLALAAVVIERRGSAAR